MEKMDGDLVDLLNNELKNLHISTKSNILDSILKQALEALIYVHDKNFIHFDIKMENLYFQKLEDGTILIKLGDFSSTYTLEEYLNLEVDPKCNDDICSPKLANVRLFEGDRTEISNKTDIWPLAIIMIEAIINKDILVELGYIRQEAIDEGLREERKDGECKYVMDWQINQEEMKRRLLELIENRNIPAHLHEKISTILTFNHFEGFTAQELYNRFYHEES